MTTENPFTQGQTLWTEHQTFIVNTARNTARSYFKVEEEDVLQEIYIFLWEKEQALLEQERNEAYIKTCIRNVANNYAQRMRDTTLRETDTFYYSLTEVKEMLPHFFSLYEDWNQTQTVETGSNYDSRDALAIFCDFSLAFELLSEPFKEILLRKYGEGEELSEAKDRQQASRALKRFWTTLNTEVDKRAKAHTGPGSRKAISNAQGVYKAKEVYYD
jgi:DNA-directed RNA polymerase specialized sigma24 family protein